MKKTRITKLVTSTEVKQETYECEKEKTTFNLSKDVIKALDEKWFNLKNKLENRITKTMIVEKALEIVFDDLETRSEGSSLYLTLKNANIT